MTRTTFQIEADLAQLKQRFYLVILFFGIALAGMFLMLYQHVSDHSPIGTVKDGFRHVQLNEPRVVLHP